MSTIEATPQMAVPTAQSAQLDWNTVTPFLMVAGGWLVLSEVLSARFAGAHLVTAISWVALLWALCLLDLFALSRAVGAALELAATDGEKRGPLVVQAFYWGVIKLICLGILGAILLYGRSIPLTSILMGSGTLVIVPLIGGYAWSQKVLRHA